MCLDMKIMRSALRVVTTAIIVRCALRHAKRSKAILRKSKPKNAKFKRATHPSKCRSYCPLKNFHWAFHNCWMLQRNAPSHRIDHILMVVSIRSADSLKRADMTSIHWAMTSSISQKFLIKIHLDIFLFCCSCCFVLPSLCALAVHVVRLPLLRHRLATVACACVCNVYEIRIIECLNNRRGQSSAVQRGA